jgi:hypothetical protein
VEKAVAILLLCLLVMPVLAGVARIRRLPRKEERRESDSQ